LNGLKIISQIAIYLIRIWIKVTGRQIVISEYSWLASPIGDTDYIGSEFYEQLAAKENLTIKQTEGCGLLEDFDLLKSKDFDSTKTNPRIRNFYEQTSRYKLEAWSHSNPFAKALLWILTSAVSRRMNQLNFPVSSLELSQGMNSDVLPMYDETGRRKYTGWLRRLNNPERVIYTGLYSVVRISVDTAPLIKVTFPVPRGSASVFLKPSLDVDGSLRLSSKANRFGGPGFYRILGIDEQTYKVRFIRTLREYFHVYEDKDGILRTDHTVKLWGVPMIKLHYKISSLE
jgi:hypothetical protein